MLNIAACKIKPSMTDILSPKQIEVELLLITPGPLSTGLPFVGENCWQEVGKRKGEAL